MIRLLAVVQKPFRALSAAWNGLRAPYVGPGGGRLVHFIGAARFYLAPAYRRTSRIAFVAAGIALFVLANYWFATEIIALRWWFVLAVFMGAVSIAVGFSRPMWALVFWFVLSPIGSQLFQLDFGTGIPAITFDRVALYFLAIATIAKALVDRKPMRRLRPGEILLLAFPFYLLLTGPFFSFDSATTFLYRVLTRAGDMVALFFVAQACIQKREHVYWILGSFAAVGIVYSAMGFYDHFTGKMSLTALVGVRVGLIYSDVGRAAGPFLSPSHLGMFLGIAIVLCMHLAAMTRRVFVKCALYSGIPFMIVALFWTYTRGGYLLLLSCLILMPFLAKRSRLTYSVALLLMVVGIATLIPKALSDESINRRLTNDNTTKARIVANATLLNLVKHNILFGVGVGNSNAEMPKYATSVGSLPGFTIWGGIGTWPKRFELPESISSHNTYLSILADHGIVGAIIFFSAIGLLITDLIRLRSRGSPLNAFDRDLVSIVVAVFFGYTLCINTTMVETNEHISCVVWLLMACVLRLGNLARQENAAGVEEFPPEPLLETVALRQAS